MLHEIRTSSGMFLSPDEDPLVAAVQQRVADFTMLPHENQEAMQVLNYKVGQRYGAHMDTFEAKDLGADSGGQRAATALLFLNEPKGGGETAFPSVPSDATSGEEWSACARGSLAHKPRTGDLIVFWNLRPDGSIDLGATHEACPVTEGEKWSAPLWCVRAGVPGGRVCGGAAPFDGDASSWAAAGSTSARSGRARRWRAPRPTARWRRTTTRAWTRTRAAAPGPRRASASATQRRVRVRRPFDADCSFWVLLNGSSSDVYARPRCCPAVAGLQFMIGVPGQFRGRCRVACAACPHPRSS